jgi:hypothetical protein
MYQVLANAGTVDGRKCDAPFTSKQTDIKFYEKLTMPKRKTNEDNIIWRNSEARCILIEDLVRGILPLERSQMTEAEAFEIYQGMVGFADVRFPQFRARLKDHRAQVKKSSQRSKYEEECLKHDRLIFPRKLLDENGTPVFDLHPAKLLLREDVAEGKHLLMTPLQLWKSRPDEYMLFQEPFFRNKMYQAVRRQKFVNYLQIKREEKKLSVCRPPVNDPEEAENLLKSRQSMSSKKNKQSTT